MAAAGKTSAEMYSLRFFFWQNDAEQTPEGLFKTMFNDETMEHW